ncbi:hypothetical protein SLEP1_g59868 [Rubroshorea leprosula]|uniref:Uncharacterized protein n=1 Tax=Rubroshorea leprosula TaxID=152421 RepID=A0AAV5MU34_9ROSI|nr:hypothetical protein SLEP1_g59868 [Rubroshorea leprosula]
MSPPLQSSPTLPFPLLPHRQSRGGEEAMEMIAKGTKKEMGMIVGGGEEQGLDF